MDAAALLPVARKMLSAGWRPGVVAGILNGALREADPDNEHALFTTQDMEKVLELLTMEARQEKAWLN